MYSYSPGWTPTLGCHATSRRLATLALAVSLPLGAASLLRAQSYTVMDLGTLGGTISYALDINNAGQIVGQANITNDAATHATLYTVTNGAVTQTDLGVLGGTNSVAAGINDAGQIVGDSYTSGNTYFHAALFSTTGGAPTDLGTLNGYDGGATGINNHNQIVGISSNHTDGTPAAATLFSSSGAPPIDLGSLGGGHGFASRINDSGQVAGGSFESNGYRHATLFTVSGSAVTRTDLGTLGGTRSAAYDLNNAGQVVGNARTTNDAASHATLFSVSGNTTSQTDLQTLGGSSSAALSINQSGAIVGESETAGDAASHEFLYTTAGGMKDLNSLLVAGSGITNITTGNIIGHYLNDFGQIIALGTLANGQQHAVLLNPTSPMANTSTTANGAAAQDTKLVAGFSYTQVPALTNAQTGSQHTTVGLLGGTASSNRDFSTTFLDLSNGAPPAGSVLASDRVSISGSGTDVFVLKLTYDKTTANALFGNETSSRLDWLDPVSGRYLNAVAGNDSGVAHFVSGAYDPATDDHLGYYGVDPTDGYVWAVVDHNSEFVVSNVDIVPEPSTTALFIGGLGLSALAIRRRSAVGIVR